MLKLPREWIFAREWTTSFQLFYFRPRFKISARPTFNQVNIVYNNRATKIAMHTAQIK